MNIASSSKTYSAVLCTYNAVGTVDRALNSILKQAVKPVEIIIVDDNSNDGTTELLEKLSSNIESIKLIMFDRNKGQSAARNAAVSISKGDVIIFFDDDDESLPMRSAIHLELHDISEISFVSSVKLYGNGYKVNNINSDMTCQPEIIDWVKKLLLGKYFVNLEKLWVPCSTSAFNRNLLVEINGFDESMRRVEDVDIFLRSLIYEPKVSWSSQILVKRFDSKGPDKGGIIDTKYEKNLLLKNKKYLTKTEFDNAIISLSLREAYFSRSFFKIFLILSKNPFYLIGNPRKVFRYFLRILHDVRK